MSKLTNQTCEACEIGAPLVPEGDQAKLLEGLDGWEIDNIWSGGPIKSRDFI